MGRPPKKRKPQEIVRIITRIRTKNNKLWMSLLELALVAKPRQAKKILKKIQSNDLEVNKWMARV